MFEHLKTANLSVGMPAHLHDLHDKYPSGDLF
jgi:hypothetical protein